MKRIAVVLLALVGTQILAAGTKQLPASACPQAVNNSEQIQPPLRINDALKSASGALNRYKEVAPDIRCEYVNYRDACKIELEIIARHVEVAEKKIADYSPTSLPRLVELFDINEELQQIFARIDALALMDEVEGSQNRVPLATAYNSFVKTRMYFLSEVRQTIQESDARSTTKDSR